MAAVAGIFVLSVAADAAGYAYVLNFDGTEVVKIPPAAQADHGVDGDP